MGLYVKGATAAGLLQPPLWPWGAQLYRAPPGGAASPPPGGPPPAGVAPGHAHPGGGVLHQDDWGAQQADTAPAQPTTLLVHIIILIVLHCTVSVASAHSSTENISSAVYLVYSSTYQLTCHMRNHDEVSQKLTNKLYKISRLFFNDKLNKCACLR